MCPICNPGVIVPCEDMKNKIGIIVPYMQPEVIVPCENIKKMIGVIVPYMQSRDYCAM